MGGLEDEEPPLKRVKSCPQESRSVLKDSPLIDPIGSSRDTMAKCLPSIADETVGSEGIIKKVEFVRIITRALYSLGYEKSGALLEEESGISLNSSTVNLFRQQVLDGKWDESVATLGKIAQLEDKVVKSASFLILEQKFFELLGKEQVLDALKTLRLEIAPLCINKDRVHELAGCIVSPARYEELVCQNALHDNPCLWLLDELQKLLPPSIMVPERRLEHLLEQALKVQRESCVFHNSLDSALSLYYNHQCGRDQIPTKTLQKLSSLEAHIQLKTGDLNLDEEFTYKAMVLTVDCDSASVIVVHHMDEAATYSMITIKPYPSSLEERNFCNKLGKEFPVSVIWSIKTKVLQSHHDEVWFLKFSHDGKHLASSSHDCTIILWEVSKDGQVSLKHTLTGHQKPVFFVAWSVDDRQLLTCGIEEVVRRWDVESGSCLQVYEKSNFGFVSCGWFPEGKKLFAGVNDRSICIWDLDGKELEWWKGQRAVKMSDMVIMSDGTVISMNKETTIVLQDRKTRTERVILEDNSITSFSISRDERYLLANLSNQEIHLWSTVGEPKLLAKYKGHKRTRLDIRSCFGGSEEAFVASGSEDSLVYIWHRGTGKLLEKLPGHSGAVNCVSWNPANPCMLASASDDRTVRIWGISNVGSKLVNACSNNVIIHHGNGIR